MIVSLRQVSRFCRMIVFVVLFSFICFKLLGIVQDMIQPTTNKYKEPIGGDAVKVSTEVGAGPHALWDELLARLAVFYQIGE
ncbi:DUF4227 family protein [Tumebacillus sp. DT12]|uniref:DUF4227 family protein n=1 Tax=Tumebacillus lacus TaxID=2995335 RepID=A0ABT3WWS4_9BACL|nr:DUF4227 family protein [Tumebacillus lacus]MCX7569129.1 DUF4227 family protein [Tumebacillus lacus]